MIKIWKLNKEPFGSLECVFKVLYNSDRSIPVPCLTKISENKETNLWILRVASSYVGLIYMAAEQQKEEYKKIHTTVPTFYLLNRLDQVEF